MTTKKIISAAAALALIAGTAAPIAETGSLFDTAVVSSADIPDVDLSSAVYARLDTNYHGIINDAKNGASFDYRLYKLTFDKTTKLKTYFKAQEGSDISLKLFDTNKKEFVNSYKPYVEGHDYCDYFLSKGTYYIFIGNQYSNKGGNFDLTLSTTDVTESFSEKYDGSNNTLETAQPVSLNTSYDGALTFSDLVDTYKFTLDSKQKVTIVRSGHYNHVHRIYDSKGNSLVYMYESGTSNKTDMSYTETRTTELSAGTYYLKIGNTSDNSYTDLGDYKFSINTAENKQGESKQSETQQNILKASVSAQGKVFKYTGKQIKPVTTVTLNGKTLKEGTDYTLGYGKNVNVGKGTLTIYGKGVYTGSKTVTFYIKPKKGKIVKAAAKKKAVKVTFKTNSKGAYTQVQVATNKKFKKGTIVKTVNVNTSKKANGKKIAKTVKGLKSKKTYYVRVRGFAKVGKVKKYGAWSAVKKFKAK